MGLDNPVVIAVILVVCVAVLAGVVAAWWAGLRREHKPRVKLAEIDFTTDVGAGGGFTPPQPAPLPAVPSAGAPPSVARATDPLHQEEHARQPERSARPEAPTDPDQAPIPERSATTTRDSTTEQRPRRPSDPKPKATVPDTPLPRPTPGRVASVGSDKATIAARPLPEKSKRVVEAVNGAGEPPKPTVQVPAWAPDQASPTIPFPALPADQKATVQRDVPEGLLRLAKPEEMRPLRVPRFDPRQPTLVIDQGPPEPTKPK